MLVLHSRKLHAFATAFVFWSSLITASWCQAQQDPLTNRVPASATSIVELQPKSALAEPSFELVPHEIIKVFGEKELGLNLLDIKRASVVVGEWTDPSMDEPPEFGIVIEFDSPQKLSERVLEQLVPTDFGTKTAYSIGPRGELLVVQDDRTLLIGSPTILKQMNEASTTPNPLVKYLEAMPAGDHFKVVVLLDPIRDLIKQNLPPRSQVPPPFGEFMALPDLIRSISYRANCSTNQISELSIEATSEKDAKKIIRLVENAIEMGKGAALSGIASQMGIAPEYEAAAVMYADRVAEFLKTGMRPQRDGATLVYDLNGLQQSGGASSVATIGVLVGMLLPAVQQVREAARRTESMNNLRQIVLAFHNYESAYRKFPMQANYDAEGKPLLSWRVHLLPFLEEQRLYEQFKLDEPWDSPHNIQLLDKMPAIYQNPNFRTVDGTTVFLSVSGPSTAFPGNKKLGFSDIHDGTSNTVIFVEADPEMAVEWTKPSDWKMNPDDPLQGLGGLRPGGFNAAFCDGSVQLLRQSISPETWKNLTEISDGNVIDYNEFGR